MLIPTITNLSQDELKLLMIIRTMHPYDRVEIYIDNQTGVLSLLYTQKERTNFLTGKHGENTMEGQ